MLGSLIESFYQNSVCFFSFPMTVTCTTHFNLLDLIIQAILGKDYTLWSSLLFNFIPYVIIYLTHTQTHKFYSNYKYHIKTCCTLNEIRYHQQNTVKQTFKHCLHSMYHYSYNIPQFCMFIRLFKLINERGDSVIRKCTPLLHVTMHLPWPNTISVHELD